MGSVNNEPVAWMLADKQNEYIRSIMAVQHDFVPEGCVEIPLYTQDQLEEARKLGMQQERALWNLSESTQEFESFDRTASHMAGEYVAHPVELTDEEIREIHEQTDGNLNMIEFARAILRKAQGD